ncbi:MAG: hypothetical protein SH809_19875 [Rhodothermales bacterium]|nr:hypothetical protein [Rhodothermales bacterium]
MRRFASWPALLYAATLLAAGVLPSVLHACRMMEVNEPLAMAASQPPCHGATVVSDSVDVPVDTSAFVPVESGLALACCAWRVAPAPVVVANQLPEPHVAAIAYEPAASLSHPTTALPSRLTDPPDPTGPARHLRYSQLLI